MVNNDREVAVTGVGIVSPLGVGRDEFWRRLCAGESGIAAGQAPDGEGAAARLSGFSPRDLIHTPHLRRMDDASRMVVGAAALALADARVDEDDADRQSLGVVVGSAFSDINDTLEYLRRLAAKGPALVSPMMFPNLVLNARELLGHGDRHERRQPHREPGGGVGGAGDFVGLRPDQKRAGGRRLGRWR
jgi:3-oxoacyl-[acyl-carrier-protein] synthase II